MIHLVAALVLMTGSPPVGVTAQTPRVGAKSDWPMFRGDGRLTGIATSDLPAKLHVRWKFESPEHEAVVSTAAIVGGVAYVTCEDGFLYALDLATGAPRWKYNAGAPISSSPTVLAGLVLFGDQDGGFHAVSVASGKKAWSFKAEAEIISSANVWNDRLVFGSYDGNVYCLAVGAGSLLWKFETEAQVHSTIGIADNCALVAGCDGSLRVLGMSNGKELRALDIDARTAAGSAIRGDHVYIGTLGNRVLCIDWKKSRVAWTYENPDRSFPFQSSAAVTDDLVIIGGRDKILHALDAETGKLGWSFRTKGRIDSSPVIVGRRVFVGSSDGNLYGLDLAGGREQWRFEAGAPISASPAVGGGCLVVGTEDGLVYCFGAKVAARH